MPSAPHSAAQNSVETYRDAALPRPTNVGAGASRLSMAEIAVFRYSCEFARQGPAAVCAKRARGKYLAGFKSGLSRLTTVHFTEAEVNAMLPTVTKLLEQGRKEKEGMDRIEATMERAGNLDEWIRMKQSLNSAATRFYSTIEKIESMGAMVKSVENGLVDFPAKKFNEDVWLCWKYGETSIKFWHDLGSGFNGRKPLEVSDEALV